MEGESLHDLIEGLGKPENASLLSKIDPSILKNVAERLRSLNSKVEGESLHDLIEGLGNPENASLLSEIDPSILKNVAERLRSVSRIEMNSSCVRLFVAGSKTHVGKTTICLGILGTLLEMGFKPSDLAYVLVSSCSLTIHTTQYTTVTSNPLHNAKHPIF